MSEEFDFQEEGIDHYDGPLSGWLRRKRDGAWFAYDCQPIISNMLWHWTLIPVPEKTTDVAGVLIAAKAEGGPWVSVVEDRRSTGTSQCRLVTIAKGAAAPPLLAVLARHP